MRSKSQRKGKDVRIKGSNMSKRKYASKGKNYKYSDAPEVDSLTNDDGKNDPSWYTNNKQLVLDAGNFSFNTPAGAVLRGMYPGDHS